MKKERKFKARAGQVDFTNVRWAPVVNCVVQYKNKILVVERSKELRLYPGYWNGISGFLDDEKSLREKVFEELKEEAGLGKKHIRSMRAGEVFDQDEPRYKKTWIVHPVLVSVDTDRITLDWEARRHQWLTLSEVKKLKLLPGFDKVLEILFR